jgi:hypothetical protein
VIVRFAIREGGKTVGAGLVTDVIPEGVTLMSALGAQIAKGRYGDEAAGERRARRCTVAKDGGETL